MLDEPINMLDVPQSPIALPPEVELILSAMEAGRNMEANRREIGRWSYRVRAELRLFSDLPGNDPWVLYTRDANARGLGFITPHRLPLGYGGRIELLAPSGRPMCIHCTLFRCRQTVQGWYEGALYFNREQYLFEIESIIR